MGDWTHINGTVTIENTRRLKANRFLSKLDNYAELREKVNSGEAEWSDFVEIKGLDNPQLYKLFLNRLFVPKAEGELLHEESAGHLWAKENGWKYETVTMEDKHGGKSFVISAPPVRLPFQPMFPLNNDWNSHFHFFQNASVDGDVLSFTWVASFEEIISPKVIEEWIKDVNDYFRVEAGVLHVSWTDGDEKVYPFGRHADAFCDNEDWV